MSGPAIGAVVQYCGHDGTFVADILEIAGVNVVRASGPVSGDTLIRPARGATHHLLDSPHPGFWRPDLGVFVVPKSQVRDISLREELREPSDPIVAAKILASFRAVHGHVVGPWVTMDGEDEFLVVAEDGTRWEVDNQGPPAEPWCGWRFRRL